MSDPPVISVIIAVYNGEATLQRCLDSFAEQTYPHKELIVLDGASKDGTVAILQANREKPTYWESEPDRGIYHAWNKGLAHAAGDWICFLGADDYFWNKDVLSDMAGYLAKMPSAVRVVYGKVAVISKSGDVLRIEGIPWKDAQHEFPQTMNIPHPGLFHHRSLFEEHGHFDETFRIVGDYDLLLRELLTHEARFVPEVTTVGFQHGGLSNSPGAMATVLQELARVRKKHGIRQRRKYSSVQWKMTLCALIVRTIGESGFRTLADIYRRATGRPAVWR